MIALIVLGVAAVLTLVIVLVDVSSGSPAQPLDTELQERWLVAHAPAVLKRPLRFLDRRVVGGALVAVSLIVVLSLAFVLGFLLDSIDRDSGFARWDRSAAEWGAEHATDESTAFMKVVTDFGATKYLLVGMAILGLAMKKRRGWGPLAYLAIVGLGVITLNNGLKFLVDRERPDIGRLISAHGTSFPSGHSAAAAACWAAIALVVCSRAPRIARAAGAIVALFVALSVAASRVLLGVHWLTDVVGGLAVGWSWFFLSTLIFGGRLLELGEPASRIARGAVTASPADEAELVKEHAS